jgi:hypothetical protein
MHGATRHCPHSGPGRADAVPSLARYRKSVLLSFAATNHELRALEVDIFDSQPATLQKPKARTVEERKHEAGNAFGARKHDAHLIARKHDRKAVRALRMYQALEPRQVDPQHFTVQEQDRGKRLILGRCGDRHFDGEVVEEPSHFLGTEMCGVSLTAKQMKAPHPTQIRPLGAAAEVTQAHCGAGPFAKPQARRGSACSRTIFRPALSSLPVACQAR